MASSFKAGPASLTSTLMSSLSAFSSCFLFSVAMRHLQCVSGWWSISQRSVG